MFKLFSSSKLIVLFCFPAREEFLNDSYYDIDTTLFFLVGNGIEEVWNNWSFYDFIKF